MDVYEKVDFGDNVGDKFDAPLDLLETASIHETLKIGSVESLFGTAPDFWNSLLGFNAKFPPSLLSNEPLMLKLSSFSMPIVRIVDNLRRCHKRHESRRHVYGHEFYISHVRPPRSRALRRGVRCSIRGCDLIG